MDNDEYLNKKKLFSCKMIQTKENSFETCNSDLFQ
jgi:hypothetical protein